MCVTGCATAPVPAVVQATKTEVLTPPVELMHACEAESFSSTTNGDLALYAAYVSTVLRACNAEKAAIKLWAEAFTRDTD